jgi:hypothetical protein
MLMASGVITLIGLLLARTLGGKTPPPPPQAATR